MSNTQQNLAFVRLFGLEAEYLRRQEERAGYPKRHPDQEEKKCKEISAVIAVTLRSPASEFDTMRDGVYGLMHREALAAGHGGVYFTAEAKTLRNAPSLRDRQLKDRLLVGHTKLAELLGLGFEFGDPEVDQAWEAITRIYEYLHHRPYRETETGEFREIKFPRKKVDDHASQGRMAGDRG